MKIEAVMAQIRRAWQPPPRLTLSQWADQHAILSAESSAEVGRWRTLPYQRGIMDSITDRHIESVTVMKSARVGWSKILNHTIGYHAHHEPCPLMLVQPTIGDAEGYSKDEIAPMIRDTPVLEALFPLPGARDAGNTILRKAFPGGVLLLIGADSPRGFRRVSIRVVMFDEVDGYSATAGEEGDQIKLGIKRSDFFWNRKILAGSTPTLDATSRIKRRFESGDQRYYFVPCPHCDHKQSLIWENLIWPKGRPDEAAFLCKEGCGALISYEHQRWMVEEADRRQLAGEAGIGWVATNPSADPRHASFHIWAAYSYSPNATWAQLAREWLDSHRNIEERKTFMNTVLGLPYKGEGDAPDWKRLYDRREIYKTGWVAGDGLILTAGVDVQKDRLEVEIVAWGPDRRSWSVDFRVIPGDTSQLDGKGSPYRALDDLLAEQFPRIAGGALSIRMLAIDSGYNTNTVYQWVRRHAANRVIAVDGRDRYSMPIGQPKAVEVNERGKRKSRAVKLWPVGTSMIKTELYGWLKQEKPTDESGEDLPFGYCTFPQYSDEYFKQLTAEEIVPRLVRGFRRYQWEKVYARNEALDCRVYARAAAALVGVDHWKAAQWATLRDELASSISSSPAAKKAVVRRPKVTKADDPYL